MTSGKLAKLSLGFWLAAVAAISIGCEADTITEQKIRTASAVSVSADDLIQSFKENEIAADDKYKGKVLKVSGVVYEVKKNALSGVMSVNLKGSRSKARSIDCLFADSERDHLARLTPGQSISVKGLCAGTAAGIVLKGCLVD